MPVVSARERRLAVAPDCDDKGIRMKASGPEAPASFITGRGLPVEADKHAHRRTCAGGKWQ